jgi:hypothetical protein
MKNYQFYLEKAISERTGEIEIIDEGMISDVIDSVKKSISGMFSGIKKDLNESKRFFKLIHQAYNVLGRDKRTKIDDLMKEASNSKLSAKEKRKMLHAAYKILIYMLESWELLLNLQATLKMLNQ